MQISQAFLEIVLKHQQLSSGQNSHDGTKTGNQVEVQVDGWLHEPLISSVVPSSNYKAMHP